DGAIVIADTRLGLLLARGGRVETVLGRDALPRQFVTAIAQTPDGDIWLGTRDAGLVRVQRGPSATVAGVPLKQQINCLAADAPSGLWIGTDDGLFRWAGREVAQAPPETSHTRTLAM